MTMTRSTRRAPLLAFAFAVAIATVSIAYWWSSKNEEVAGTSMSGSRSESNEIRESALRRALSQVARANKTESSRVTTGVDVFPQVPKSRTGLALEDDPFGAESIEEQRWLDRNGYPNATQWEIYSAASDALLAAAAQGGDSVAKDILDSRRLAVGDPAAMDDLLVSAAKGSGFALELLAGYMQGSKKGGDPISGYALRRVQEMRGNYRVAIARELFQAGQLGPMERAVAEAEALQTFNDLNRLQFQLTGRDVHVDPRPVGGGGE